MKAKGNSNSEIYYTSAYQEILSAIKYIIFSDL